MAKFEGIGQNGNTLMGSHARPVRMLDEHSMPIRTFGSLTKAGEWLVRNHYAKSINSARVGITHALNGKQHYNGKDHYCSSRAFGLKWSEA